MARETKDYVSDLADRVQANMCAMSYNDVVPGTQKSLKHLLKEVTHTLNSSVVKVLPAGKEYDGTIRPGPVIRDALGKKRMLTTKERVAIWLLGGRTEVRP